MSQSDPSQRGAHPFAQPLDDLPEDSASEESRWDSFRIYGYLGIIALLLLSGVFFVVVLSQ